MSDAETGIGGKAIVPPVDTFVLNDQGMTAWSAVFESLTVERLPGGMRSLKVIVKGACVYNRVFTDSEAAHLARLLAP